MRPVEQKLTPDQIAEFVALWNANTRIKDMATKFGYSSYTIFRWSRMLDLPRRNETRSNLDMDRANVLAARLGVTATWLCGRLGNARVAKLLEIVP